MMAPFTCDLCNEGLDSRRQAHKHFDKVHGGYGTLSSLIASSSPSPCDNVTDPVNVKVEELDTEPDPADPEYILPGDLDETEEDTEQVRAPELTVNAMDQAAFRAIRDDCLLNAKTGRAKCRLCFKSYKSYAGFRGHYQRDHLRRRFTCSLCDKQFTQRPNFDHHQQTQHHGIRFRCLSCNQLFDLESKFLRHQGAQGCKVGQAPAVVVLPPPITERHGLKSHLQNVDDLRPRQALSCQYCPKSFYDGRRKYLHMRSCPLANKNSGFPQVQLPPTITSYPRRRPGILPSKPKQN